MSSSNCFSTGVIATDYFSCTSSENVISPSVLKGIFHWIENDRMTVLFFRYFKNIVPLLFSLHEKSAVIWIIVPLLVLCYFSGCFQDFFFIFAFSVLIKMCLGMNLFQVILFRVLLAYYRFMLLPHLARFQQFFFKSF